MPATRVTLSQRVASAQPPPTRQCCLVPDSTRSARHDEALLVSAALHEFDWIVMREVKLVLSQVLIGARVAKKLSYCN